LSDELRASAEALATEFLWNWTGRVFGSCVTLLRPCRVGLPKSTALASFLSSRVYHQGLFNGSSQSPFQPLLLGGQWLNISCGQCGQYCSCESTPSLQLPYPVTQVTEVRIEGVVLPWTSYRLDNSALLVRTDGERWPISQDMEAPAGDPNTWSVEFDYGRAVPIGGQVAAGVLALEFAKVLCNDSSCKLPQRVQTITRQGVTVGFMDLFTDLDKGHTGLWLVDSWVASVTMPKRGGQVFSVDVPRKRYNLF
jgi:hypothetical protein